MTEETTDIEHVVIGGYNKVRPDMIHHLKDLVTRIEHTHSLSSGSTALFWHLVAVLNIHIQAPKTDDVIAPQPSVEFSLHPAGFNQPEYDQLLKDLSTPYDPNDPNDRGNFS